jgi:pre-rRNA-processing protein TSR3
VNFGKATKLTTAEAIAAALYIAGLRQEATKVLSIFTWGHTFLELNGKLLENYAGAKDSTEVVDIQRRLMSRR